MFRKGIVFAAAALFLAPVMARAQGFDPGDFELTLGGNAANGPDFNGFTAGANAGIGYFLTDNLEIALRQSLNYTDVGTSGSALNGSTRAALDFHFDLGSLQPFLGANIGYVYGDSVNDTWEAAPEGGVKWFLNTTTFIYGMVEYQFFFDHTNQITDNFSDGQFVYTLGIGLKF